MAQIAKKKKKTDTLKRLENIFFWLGTGGIIVLFAFLFVRLTNNQPQPSKKLNDKEITQYELQDKHLTSLTSLVNNPQIHSFFTDLLTTYAKHFADNQNIDISHTPLVFEGVFFDEKTGKGWGKMGWCLPSPFFIDYPHREKITIGLNRLYLLNKFGHDKYFTSNPAKGDYYYLDISFDKMIKTCSHEIAHYIQLVKHGKSSCESDLKLDNGGYNEELAKEQEEWTKEIYQLIKNSAEYSEWERKWKEIN